MSHPIRKWLKETLQYGRRSVQTPADAKAPLLWLADLPRLGSMWVGHLWFRTWLDLRSIPPRVKFAPREVFSPHVHLHRPAQFRPLRPVMEARAAIGRFDRWLSEGGLQRGIAQLGDGFLGGLLGLIGGIAIALMTIIGTGISFLAGLAGISAIAGVFGLNSFAEGIRRLAGDMRLGMASHWSRLKTPHDLAWSFATITGTVGLILLMVHQSVGWSDVASSAQSPEITHVAQRPPTSTFVPPQETPPAAPDFAGELPNPFGPPPAPMETDEPVDEPVQEKPADEPIQEPVEKPPAAPELVISVGRAELPADVARFNLPDSAEMFLVESALPELLEPTSLPVDDWLRFLPQNGSVASPVIPAAYRATEVAIDSPLVEPKPNPAKDQFTTATRSVGVTIEKTQPTQAVSGELIRYELIVTNQGEKRLSQVVVEERVTAPHRVAEAQPAAQYSDGVLTWRLDALEAGESRRLQVGVYPMSPEPIETSATVRPVATFSTATYVQEPEPEVVVEPEPIAEPEPIVEPTPTPNPEMYRRIKIAMTTPKLLKNGFSCDVEFVVTNTGTVPLTGVVLRSVLPPELQHEQGKIVKMPIGALAPGASYTATLHVTGTALGSPSLVAEVSANEGVATSVRGSFEIVEQLK